jgi:plastocyanin
MLTASHPTFNTLTHLVSVVMLSVASVSCGKVSESPAVFRSAKPMIEVASGNSISGTVVLTGGSPSELGKAIDVGGNPLCSQHGAIIDPKWRVSSDGGFADVVVSVRNGSMASNVSPTEVLMDQRDCLFVPNVLSVQAGQSVRFRNSDMTFHNVRVVKHQLGSELQGKSVENFAQASMGGENSRVFDEPGIYRVECDVHRWMRGWIAVVEGIHFAVSDREGNFQISRVLPDGKYVLEAWHAQFPEPLVQTVQVKGGVASAHFEFKLDTAFRS